MKKILAFTIVFVVFFSVALLAQEDYEAQKKAYEQQMIAYRANLSYTAAAESYKGKEFEKAIEQFKVVEITLDSLESLNPKTKKMYAQTELLMADAYKKSEKYNEAAETFLKVQKYDPANIDAPYQAMIAYTKVDSIDKAIEVGNTIIEKDPSYVKVYPALGNIYKGQEKYDEAATAYQKAIELEPEEVGNMFPLADLLYDKKKDYTGAADIYEKILAKDAASDKALYYYGVVLEKQGKNDAALEKLNKVDPAGDYGTMAKDFIKYVNDKKKQGK